MTVAICCVSPEGVVFGADSTASAMVQQGGFHYLNHNQKIFEIGRNSSLGIMTWGLASLGNLSHRTQIAQLGDDLSSKAPSSVFEVCELWIERFWPNYQNIAKAEINTVKKLDAKKSFDKSIGTPAPNMRSEDEERLYQQLKLGLVVGFCIGGYVEKNREPTAYSILFDPLKDRPTPEQISTKETRCWGTPKIFERIIHGIDFDMKAAILNSPHWTGNQSALDSLLTSHLLYFPDLPIRDAVDFVFSSVSSTIKTLKFSHLSQTCGGPIEIAVVTSDRNFRWVRHKEWDAAINEGHIPWKS